MTDIDDKTCTAVTVLFEGAEHKAAAHDFIIQFSDGGLAEHFEDMFKNVDRNMNIETSDFDTQKRTITLKFDP